MSSVSKHMDPPQVSIPNLPFVFLHSYFKMVNQEARPFANNIVSDITSSVISSSLQEKIVSYLELVP